MERHSDSCSEIGTDDEDDFRERLKRTLEASGQFLEHWTPALPVGPDLWRRISRWHLNGAPTVYLQFLMLFAMVGQLQFGHLDFLEFCAGLQHMRRSFSLLGYAAYGFDITQDRIFEDYVNEHGFAVALCMLYHLNCIALVSFAPACSSWICLSRSKTGRSSAYPLGWESCTGVQASHPAAPRFVSLLT